MSVTESRTSQASNAANRDRGRNQQHMLLQQQFDDSADDRSNNFKVVIRVRPPLPRELNGHSRFQNVISVDTDCRQMTISENLNVSKDDETSSAVSGQVSNTNAAGQYSSHVFTFDHVYDQNCDQSTVYQTTAKGVVESSLQGYNATIFAYGQTGTGKTYTMEGFHHADADFNAAMYNATEKRGKMADRGIIPRAIEQIFHHIEQNLSVRTRFLVRASYLQIYNEQISDLLKPERNNLTIREDKKKGVFVEGLSEWVVRSSFFLWRLGFIGVSQDCMHDWL
jgi:hypothetical protein